MIAVTDLDDIYHTNKTTRIPPELDAQHAIQQYRCRIEVDSGDEWVQVCRSNNNQNTASLCRTLGLEAQPIAENCITDLTVPEHQACRNPGIPEFGFRRDNSDVFPFGATVEYDCDGDYRLQGAQRLECVLQDAHGNCSWSDEIPMCVIKMSTSAATGEPGTAHTNAADAALTSTIIIGAATVEVGIFVIIIVIGVVIYCKRRKTPERETPKCEPYAMYRSPTDDSSQRPPTDISGPELPGHLPVSTNVPSPDNSSQRPPIDIVLSGPEDLHVPYATYVPPTDISSQHPPIDISGPEHPGHLPVPHATYVPPTDDSSQHPPIDTSGPEYPGHLPVSYATYVPPTDDSSQHPPINISGPELPGHLPVSYSTYVPPTDDSSQHPPIDISGPELPGHLPVAYSTYVPPINSSAYPHVDASDDEIPLENMGNENVDDDITETSDEDGYIEVIP
ncbi:uncharacterized protein [Amphiura filiformis]|uniref:uncharacterized protein n=1 Tax=Amphiura filiformis TaxID=82378 RepID=UPI003B20BBBD